MKPAYNAPPFPRLAFIIATSDRFGGRMLAEEVHQTLADAARALPEVVDPTPVPQRITGYRPAPAFSVKVIGEDRPMRDMTFEACRLLVADAIRNAPVTTPVDAWIEEHLPEWLSEYLGDYLPGLLDYVSRDIAAETVPLGALEVV